MNSASNHDERIRRMFAAVALIFVLPSSGYSQVEQAGKISEIIPPGVKNWSISYFEYVHEFGRVNVVIESAGNLTINGSYRSASQRKLGEVTKLEITGADSQEIFDATRDLFNHCPFGELKISDPDNYSLISFTANGTNEISFQFSHFGKPAAEVGVSTRRIFKVLTKYDLDRRFYGNRRVTEAKSISTDLKDRFPINHKNWSFGISSFSAGSPPDAVIWVPPNQIAMTPADEEIKYRIARKILNRYEFFHSQDPNDTKSSEKLDVRYYWPNGDGSSLRLTCSRQQLVDIGVLDELNAWIADFNRRLSAKKVAKLYVPPWDTDAIKLP